MIKGWAIYPEYKRDNAFDWMIKSAAEHSIELRILFATDISCQIGSSAVTIHYQGEELSLPSFVLMRHYDFVLSEILEKSAVRTYNTTESMRSAQNKLITHYQLSQKCISTPKTIYGCHDFSILSDRLTLPFVVKAVRGSKGEEVFLVSNINEFNGAKTFIDKLGGEFIAQKYIATSYGRDIRVWVVGGKVVGHVMRHNSTSFKSNIALGGFAESIALPTRVEKLAIESCKAIGLEMGGVDILFDGDDYSVCEVNGNAGFRAFGMAGEKIDIPAAIFAYIASNFTRQ